MPTSLRKLREFLGLINFYRHFIPNCADIVQPLTDMLKNKERKNQTITLDERELLAFKNVKSTLVNATLLVHPRTDIPHCLFTDASDVGIGGVIQQYVNGVWQPLAFFTRRYSTFGRELLAIYLSVKHFRHMLEGRSFCVYTDHKTLTYALQSMPDSHSPREVRQLDYVTSVQWEA